MNKEEYQSAIDKAVMKIGGHVQMDMPSEYANKKRLYTITTICYGDRFTSTRCVAVCSDWNKAIEIVEGNCGDIWEYSYGLCVIEPVLDNRVYGYVGDEVYWFVWTGTEEEGQVGKYCAIETPDECKNVFGWGVG